MRARTCNVLPVRDHRSNTPKSLPLWSWIASSWPLPIPLQLGPIDPLPRMQATSSVGMRSGLAHPGLACILRGQHWCEDGEKTFLDNLVD